MATTWNNDITSSTDWGGDASTGNLPVSGRAIQKFIKDQFTQLQSQINTKSSIVILTQAQWDSMEAAGTLQSNVLYGILEDDDTEESGQNIEIDTTGTTLTVSNATYNSTNGTIELEGTYNATLETLTLEVGGSSASTNQTATISNDALTMTNVTLGDNNITLVGTYNATDSTLTITV